MNKTIRSISLLSLGVITFLLGLMRQKYIINIIDHHLPILLLRTNFTGTSYPHDVLHIWQGITHDPRWISSVIYLIYPAIATLIATLLLFKHPKTYLYIGLLFYGTGLTLLLLCIILGIIFNQEGLAFGLAQHLKKIYQEPYISLLLIGVFYWDQQKKK